AQICNKGVGARRVSNRYYIEKSITCHNCSKSGHLSKNCPRAKKVPCCSLCGLRGHLLRTCPNRHCSNCSLPGHTYDDCLERAYWHKCCRRCGMTGHFCDTDASQAVSGTHAPLVTPNNNPTERDRNGGGRETSRNVTFRNGRRDERGEL
uniref:Zinc finger CCHC domain-containing protein 7 n=1 Tax=Cyprinus carpio carpio TaxID=630221 RepID=A0A9J7ZAG0_CYPCA